MLRIVEVWALGLYTTMSRLRQREKKNKNKISFVK